MDISENKLQKGQQRYVQGYYCNTREEQTGISYLFVFIYMSKRNARKKEKKTKTKTGMNGIIAQLISNISEEKKFREKRDTEMSGNGTKG